MAQQHTVIAAVIAYFALACLALGVVFLPGWRAALRRAWRRGAARGRAAFGTLAGRGRARRCRRRGAADSRADAAARRALLRRHGPAALLALGVLVAAPLAVLALRGRMPLDTFDHTASREIDARVAALLRGEQLVPPPALPPELFTTRAVEEARPLVRFASREWALLDADFRQRLLLVFKLVAAQGWQPVLLEGFRSAERQAQLAQAGPGVTLAGAYQSYHQFGLAADIAFLRDGRIVISERDPWAMAGYERLGESAASVGLTWGGGWRSLRDYGHVELRRPGVLQRRDDGALAATPLNH